MLKNSEPLFVRKFRLFDVYELNKLYDSLSEESKCYFHPGFLGFKSLSFRWVLAQLALTLSSVRLFQGILYLIYPPSVISSVVSTDRNGAITGFAFIKGKTGKSNSKVRELGIFVRDDLRGKRIGSILLKSILRIAKEESISTVYLTVLLENSRAIRLYKRYGFRTINILRNGDEWRRKKMDCAEMSLNLIYNLQPFEVPRKKS